jgi:hypothetical protein
MLATGQTYREFGPDYFDKRNANATLQRALRRIQHLGYSVTLQAAPTP